MDIQKQTVPSATQQLVDEIADDAALVKKAIVYYKQGGLAKLAELMPYLVDEAKQDIQAAIAAAPEIRAGYKTTEFWLTTGVVAAVTLVPMFTGKPLPFDTTVALASVAGIYTIARGLLKSKSGQ